MKVSPITSRNYQQNTNFKSKLPAMNYKYTKGYSDYWNEFAEQCFQEGKGSRLKNALDKLKSNSDENLLVLTHSKTADKNINEYTFSLHTESKTKDIYMEKAINPKNIVVKQFSDKKEVNGEVSFLQSDSLATVILRALENIIDPIMPANKAIFGDKQKASARLISEYRI